MTKSSKSAIFVILAGSLVVCLAFGVRSTFGLFLEPISGDLGWGREVFALSVAFQNLLWGVMQPFAGGIADRYGSGRVIFIGGVIYILGLVLMATATSPLDMHIANGLLVGTALAGTAFGIVFAAIARAVPEEQRSFALGIATAAGSVGQFLVVPLGQAFLSHYGWSTALLLLAAMIAIILPLSSVLRGTQTSTSNQTMSDALAEAGGQRSFWLLTSGFFVCGFHVAFIAIHMPAFLKDAGFAPQIGAWSIALIGAFNIIGSLSAGWLGSRYSKKYLLSTIYLGRAIAIALFMLTPMTVTTVFLFAAVMGLLWLSTVPLTSGLVGQIFGPKYMGMLFGIVFLSHQLGSFLGVWLGGRLFDQTGSYDVIWWWGVALGVASAIVHWPIDERPLARHQVSPAAG